MCGIYGTTIQYEKHQITKKMERFAFRGPDKTDVVQLKHNDQLISLGHNRLSIVDLEPRSNQPFCYNKKIYIVFNGEIYNFKLLRNEMKGKGFLFHTESDTEVICATYLVYGKECVKHFNGMFAFVIYDIENNRLFGARDRLGKKPFYYCHQGKNFEFCSQLSGISMFRNDLHVSENAISHYLAWKTVPDPFSIYNEIEKLPAGFSFTYQLDSGKFEKSAYWDVIYNESMLYKGTYEEAQFELEKLLMDAVQVRLFADVPLGVFLSGGIDSSLVTALAVKSVSNKINTFSIKFNEQGFDESQFAKQVAMYLGTDHHTIECNTKEALGLIENFAYYYDEPFADSSALPSMLLSKHTKKHVTVALSGDGGDESFLGYDRFRRFLNKKKYYAIPYPIRNVIANGLSMTGNSSLSHLGLLLSDKNLQDAYISSVTLIDKSWLTNTHDYMNINEKEYLGNLKNNTLEKISVFETKSYLNWDINTKVDRASMAFSLETRAPLMDYRVVEFSKKLPTNFKFESSNQKKILKDILYKHIPKSMLDRPKSGFAIPLGIWFKNELRALVQDELSLKSLKNIYGINPQITFQKIQKHLKGQENNEHIIWSLLVLKQWMKANQSLNHN